MGGGGLLSTSGNLTLISCWFSGNSTCLRGGGLYIRGGFADVIDCTFTGNSCSSLALGGGVANEIADVTMLNCVLVDNHAVTGGGLYSNGGVNMLINCSFAENTASKGPSIACDSTSAPSTVDIANCVLWDSAGGVSNNDVSAIAIRYSNVWGGWDGDGNIDADPLFADSVSGNVRLSAGSPCIDAGDNAVLPSDEFDRDDDLDMCEILSADCDGNARRQDDPNTVDSGAGAYAIVDMGAFEFGNEQPSGPCPCDFNGNRQVDLSDLAMLLANYGETNVDACSGDLDDDRDVDLADLATLLSRYGEVCEWRRPA